MGSYPDSRHDCLGHRLKSDRSYAILGTGALGGYYGACLQRASLDVHFLLNSDREQVKEYGLVIESPKGDFTLPHVNAYGSFAKMPPCDVVVVALKTTQNHLLPEMLPSVVKVVFRQLIQQTLVMGWDRLK